MNNKKAFIGTSVVIGLLLSALPAFAHVVVKPNEVGVAAFQTFTIGVPNEKDNATVALRLVIPEGLKYVSPNVKPGWKIDIKKEGEGEDAKVKEINWTGGSIPAGQRDDFFFSAQVPAQEVSLLWKAYQTYENGEEVAWDQKPSSNHDDESVTPYSETKVVNDLNASTASGHGTDKVDGSKENLPIIFSIAAVIMSAGALFLQSRKKK